MSIDSDAQICYGYPLVDEDGSERPMPWEEKPYEGDYDQWVEAVCPDKSIIVISHCSDSYTMHILALARTHLYACRGDVVLFHPELLHVTEDEQNMLRQFATGHNLELAGPQGWFLTSWLG